VRILLLATPAATRTSVYMVSSEGPAPTTHSGIRTRDEGSTDLCAAALTTVPRGRPVERDCRIKLELKSSHLLSINVSVQNNMEGNIILDEEWSNHSTMYIKRERSKVVIFLYAALIFFKTIRRWYFSTFQASHNRRLNGTVLRMRPEKIENPITNKVLCQRQPCSQKHFLCN
jgi:hypothetical protein